MEVIWHGTASVEIRSGKNKILFDPFVPLKGGDNQIDISEFDNFDKIFVTHNHFDHVYCLPEIVKRNAGVTVYCTVTPYLSLLKDGVSEKNLHLIKQGETYDIGGFEITALRGKHADIKTMSPKLWLRCVKSKHRRNLPVIIKGLRKYKEMDETTFYEISDGDKKIQVVGSLNLREDEPYPKGADALILAYNGWTDNFTVAEKVIKSLNPLRILLDHYDNTFPPATEPIDLKPILKKYKGRIEPLSLHDKVII